MLLLPQPKSLSNRQFPFVRLFVCPLTGSREKLSSDFVKP